MGPQDLCACIIWTKISMKQLMCGEVISCTVSSSRSSSFLSNIGALKFA